MKAKAAMTAALATKAVMNIKSVRGMLGPTQVQGLDPGAQWAPVLAPE
eukprot:CAMPEP_0168426766 /NCGR_PEP_ID=MMETSP0228-20121227/36002_1 /TAXON_ID=133427 /ORGANISM="Protoceratium reticulatum, Strain CCCM 535 (=CCMP 1889)" /LENGTH=47 /DNA_ID= /DNA_START= /DNA_END= /DNA_ORIENTATION=